MFIGLVSGGRKIKRVEIEGTFSEGTFEKLLLEPFWDYNPKIQNPYWGKSLHPLRNFHSKLFTNSRSISHSKVVSLLGTCTSHMLLVITSTTLIVILLYWISYFLSFTRIILKICYFFSLILILTLVWILIN